MSTPRYFLQGILNGTMYDTDLPLVDVEINFPLSGPDIIKGVLNPEIPRPRTPDIHPGASWLHVEKDSLIRASGILQPAAISEDGVLTMEAVGITDYPYGIPFLGEFALGSPIGVRVDPLDVVRYIWDHVQSYSEGNLGVTIDSITSPVRIGTEKQEVDPNNPNATVDSSAGPYTLDWWEGTDCGNEIDGLAKETPFDYRSAPQWNSTRTGVLQRVQPGYPRLGSKRTDLRFRDDENILEAIPVQEEPGYWASQVVVHGAGEGRDSIQGYAGQRFGDRIRKVHRIVDKSITDNTRANAVAADDLIRRQAAVSMGRIVINASHPNAPIGSFIPGDDIYVQSYFPWVGEYPLWNRIMNIAWRPDEDEAVLTLAPSDSFRYGSL